MLAAGVLLAVLALALGMIWAGIGTGAVCAGFSRSRAADVFIDTNLKMNGIADGKISYSRVVRLLLQYYRQQSALLQ